MNRIISPLRYPGGKTKLFPLIKLLINKANIINGTYIEPFAGGSGVALSLLMDDVVDTIVINDYDKAIYSFWRTLTDDTNKLIRLIRNTPISVEEWKRQKDIYSNNNKRYSAELGFAAFYLNRCNHSGILKAGPIGGYGQAGNYQIDARFNKENLIDRIYKIASKKSQIVVYNKEIRSFIVNYIPKYKNNSFIYFDPPYYKKGEELYKNFFVPKDHSDIADLISKNIDCFWLVTYDDVKEIKKLYDNYEYKKFDLNYSLANTGKASEIMLVSDEFLWPSQQEILDNNILINLR